MRPSSNAPSRIKRRRRQVLLRIKEVDGSSNAVVVFSETRGARDEVLVVPPEYYRNQCKIEELYQKGVGISRDGAFITGLFLEGAKWNLEKMCLQEPEVI